MKKDTVFVLSYLEFILYGHDWMDRTMLFQFRFYSTDDVEYEFMIPDFLFFIISKSDFVLMCKKKKINIDGWQQQQHLSTRENRHTWRAWKAS